MPIAGWFYDLLMKPLGWLGLDRLRRRLVGSARGRTLEIGVGTGLNLDLYEPSAAPLVALDVDRAGLLRAHRRTSRALLVQASVEALPFRDGVFNTVVSCLVFCSVPNPAAGLDEVHRVLDASGELMMLEHVRPAGRFLGWLARSLDADVESARWWVSAKSSHRRGARACRLSTCGLGPTPTRRRARVARASLTGAAPNDVFFGTAPNLAGGIGRCTSEGARATLGRERERGLRTLHNGPRAQPGVNDSAVTTCMPHLRTHLFGMLSLAAGLRRRP